MSLREGEQPASARKEVGPWSRCRPAKARGSDGALSAHFWIRSEEQLRISKKAHRGTRCINHNARIHPLRCRHRYHTDIAHIDLLAKMSMAKVDRRIDDEEEADQFADAEEQAPTLQQEQSTAPHPQSDVGAESIGDDKIEEDEVEDDYDSGEDSELERIQAFDFQDADWDMAKGGE